MLTGVTLGFDVDCIHFQVTVGLVQDLSRKPTRDHHKMVLSYTSFGRGQISHR